MTMERVTNTGQYKFGSVKVFIELKNDKLCVRVGGGFTGFIEFLRKEHAKFVTTYAMIKEIVEEIELPEIIYEQSYENQGLPSPYFNKELELIKTIKDDKVCLKPKVPSENIESV